MKQLFLFHKERKRGIGFLVVSICLIFTSVFIGKVQSIGAAVSKDDLSGNVASVSSISQYDFEKGRTSKDNQGIDKEYSLRFLKNEQTPVTTGKKVTFTEDDADKHGNGKAFFVKDNEKGKVSALYKNLAEYTIYDGTKVKEVIPLDYKVTITDWEVNNSTGNHYITFGATTGVGIRNMNWVRVKSEFYKAGTTTKVSVKGLMSITDVDDCQFVGIRKEEAEKIYVNKKDTNLSYGTPKVGDTFLTLYNKTPGNGASGDKYRNMFAFTMTGSSFDQIFGTTESPSGVDWFFITSNKYVFTELSKEAPIKSIYDDDEKNVTMNHVSSRLDSWTYHVNQEVPREDISQNYWDSFQFDDEIESCLNIESIKVFNQDEKDVSSQFTITKNGQHVTAKAKNVKSAGFYENTYSLRVQVRVKKEAESNFEAHGHYNSKRTELRFKNTASSKIVAGSDTSEKKTNEVETIVELPETTEGNPGLNIKKSVEHYEWQAKDEVSYKVKVSQENKDAVATEVVVTDTSMPEDLVIDENQVKVSGVEKYDFHLVKGGWILETGQLAYGQIITIEFKAKASPSLNGKEIVNTAEAKAYAVPVTKDDAKIYINSPKLQLKKSTNKKEYKLGDCITYHLDLIQENEGCFMRNVVVEDSIKTEGVNLKAGSISVRDADGKDITKECDIKIKGNGFTIETHKNLVKGKNPYGFEKETKISVTYEAEIQDEKLAGFDIENIAKAPPTENTNGDIIREDKEIPSGGDEDEAKVFVKGAELSIKKDSDQTKYEYGTYGIYTVITKQLRENYTAKNVVLTDQIEEKECKLDLKSIQVFYNEKDITKQCIIDGNQGGYKIQTKQDLPFGSEIKVTYRVKFPKNMKVTQVHNTATVSADNAQEKKAKNMVTLGKKGQVTTKTTKTSGNKTGKTPRTGDQGEYVVFILVGAAALLLGIFLVLKKKIRYN